MARRPVSRFSFFRKKGRGRSFSDTILLQGVSKRQRFVIVVIVLTLGLFFSEYLLGKSGIYLSFILSIATSLLLYWSNYRDIKGNFTFSIFILPFFYSLAFGLFYFLTPARLISRFIVTSLYALGLYSLMLSQNIFTVSSIHTIALLSSARTVSFIITLLSYFFLTNIIYTLRFSIVPTALLVFITSLFLIAQSLWTYTLEKSVRKQLPWAVTLAVALSEISLMLWFLPDTPTVLAIFLTGMFYIVVGLSHVWFDKRLFRGVLWEYGWVGAIVFSILIFFTSWTP